MAISIRCSNPDCNKTCSVKDEYASKKVKCPGCGRPITVPSQESALSLDEPAAAPSSRSQPAAPRMSAPPAEREELPIEPRRRNAAAQSTAERPARRAVWPWLVGMVAMLVLGAGGGYFVNSLQSKKGEDRPGAANLNSPNPAVADADLAKRLAAAEQKASDASAAAEALQKRLDEALQLREPKKIAKNDPELEPVNAKSTFKKYRGTFQKANLSKGQKSTVLLAGDSGYLLRIVPSNEPQRDTATLEASIKSQLLVAKAQLHNRFQTMVSQGHPFDTLKPLLNELDSVERLLENELGIRELATNLQVVEKLGLESGVQYDVEGIAVRDSSDTDEKWLIVKSINARPVCTEEEALSQRVENPEYFSWSNFKPGATVNYTTRVIYEKKPSLGTNASTLVDVDPETVVVRNSHSFIKNGEAREVERKELRIPRYLILAKRTIPQKLDSGTETIAGMEVKWVKTGWTRKLDDGEQESTETRWTSSAIPGSLVKTTTTNKRKGPGGKDSNDEGVVELKAVSGPSTEAIAKEWQQHRLLGAKQLIQDLEVALTKGDKLVAHRRHCDVVDFLGNVEAIRELRDRENAIPWPTKLTCDLGGGEKLALVWIAPGNFQMGSANGAENERPVHKVTFTRGFYIGETEMTEAQWKAITGNFNRGYTDNRTFISPLHPADSLSVDLIVNGLDKFAQNIDWPGQFRLPMEAEWEYACRAGSATAYSFGDAEGTLGEHAWFKGNSGTDAQPVAKKKPNAWGLYDMHGNAPEWCLDPYIDKYPVGNVIDPKPVHVYLDYKFNKDLGVARGGSWQDDGPACRSAARSSRNAGTRLAGFRIVFNPAVPRE